MDRDVTIRFYEVVNSSNHGPALETVLAAIYAARPRDRESDAPEVRLRLEMLREEDGVLLGDVTRVQTENLPGHVTDETTDALPVHEIGHWVAFCYDPATRVIAIQFDQKMSIGRVLAYFSEFGGASAFSYYPVLTQDALERFRNQRPTKITLQMARVRNFRDVRQQTTDFETQIENMGELFDGPTVEISISTRGADRQLDGAQTWNTIRRWLGFREETTGVNKILAKTIESEEPFNFIKELLKSSSTLNLPNNDPARNRQIRIEHVKECYDEYRGYLRGILAAA